MVENTRHLDPFKAYLMPQGCIGVQKMFLYSQMIVGTWQSTYIIFNLVKKQLFLVKNKPQRKNLKFVVNF